MNRLIERIETLSIDPNYWHQHSFWLAIAWFVAAFLAVFIRKSSKAWTVIRVILYTIVYGITLYYLTATILRLVPIFYRFDTWPFWRRVHIIAQVILGLLLAFHMLVGISAIVSTESAVIFKKLQSPLGHLYRLLVILCFLIISRYYVAMGLLAAAVGEWYILKTKTPLTLKEMAA